MDMINKFLLKFGINLKESSLEELKQGNVSYVKEKLNGEIPVTREELIVLINSWGRNDDYTFKCKGEEIKIKRFYSDKGYPLHNLDVSKITDMDSIFKYSYFNWDISNWDVSNVTTMENMFENSLFNGDISKWNTKNVINMSHMFERSKFDRDISKWNVSSVKDMSSMFSFSQFNNDISKWNVNNVENMFFIFCENQVFNQNLNSWKLNKNVDCRGMFYVDKDKNDETFDEWLRTQSLETKNYEKIFHPNMIKSIYQIRLEK